MTTQLLTERLRIVPMTSRDVDDVHAVWTEEAVRQFLWDGQVIPLQQTEQVVAESERLFAENGLGLWAVRSRGTNVLVGFAGYWFFRDESAPELIYGVASAHWRRGIATELARAMVDYGRSQLGMREIRASTDAPNVASIRVLEKCGFTFDRRETVKGLDTMFYRYGS